MKSLMHTRISIHQIILNGDIDTGATTNINIIDGNTSALPDGNKTDLSSSMVLVRLLSQRVLQLMLLRLLESTTSVQLVLLWE